MKNIHLDNKQFYISYDTELRRLTKFIHNGDEFDTNYAKVDQKRGWGEIGIHYKPLYDPTAHYEINESSYLEFWTGNADPMVTVDEDRFSLRYTTGEMIDLTNSFRLTENILRWEINLKNVTNVPVRVADLILPLVVDTHYVEDTLTTYTQKLIRHSSISGNGSFLYWCRPNGVGPFLLMTPEKGTHLEFYERDYQHSASGWGGTYSAYIHSEMTGTLTPGDWRQPHTGITLEPGCEVKYAFAFQWVADHFAVRDALYDNGLPDVTVVPGMTIPRDMDAKLAIRLKDAEPTFSFEYPQETTFEKVEVNGEYQIYRIAFAHNGENLITIEWGEGYKTHLEFFSTHSIKDLLDMRTQHIIHKQQYKGEKWYNGLMSVWEMSTMQLATPDNTLGLHKFCASGADDPALGRATFVAYKNVSRPCDEEIKAVEYYIEHFLWGKLQRTDNETPHPCGIYGSDSWYENRNCGSGYNNGGHGMERMWRTFDYTHIVQLYYMMYKIAKYYPDKTEYLDAQGYLDRAYMTAKAFFEVPYSIYMRDGWAFTGYTDWAFKQGNFHERFISYLIDDLEAEGHAEKANKIRDYWETKVKYFIYDHPYPYGSEMYFDSTAFESTHAIAQYGLNHTIKPDNNGFYDKNMYGPGKGGWRSHDKVERSDFDDFMHKQMVANLACRASIEPQYYMLGSDFRQMGNTNFILTYMTQMGGWAVMDYAQHHAVNYQPYLRLGYTSYLAALALIHTGEDYPWWPHADNKGASGWVFAPEKYGPRFMKSETEYECRGPWSLDGEMDNGYTGTLQSACTTLADDDIFGKFAFCGQLVQENDGYRITPMDGIGQRFVMLSKDGCREIAVNRDELDSIYVSYDGKKIFAKLKNATQDNHVTKIELWGMEGFKLHVNGKQLCTSLEDRAEVPVTWRKEYIEINLVDN